MRRWFSRLLSRIWFRRLRSEGPALPTGPVLLVLNHPNGLLDPLVATAVVDPPPRFMAKATLWKIWPLRPLLAIFDPIPVHRPKDGGATAEQTAATFSTVHEVLRSGGCVGLFPEGISHTMADLAPLKTGAARIALSAPVRPEIIPAGLVFGQREVFRDNAVLRVGAPIPYDDLQGLEPEVVRALTERIRAALLPLTVHAPETQHLRLAEKLAWLLADAPGSRADLDRLRARQRVLHDFVSRLDAAAFTEVATEVEGVWAWLREKGLRPDQIGHDYTGRQATRWAPKAVLRATLCAVCLPFGLLFWPPYRAIGWVVERVNDERDLTASYRLLIGLFALPLWAGFVGWLLVAQLGWFHLGWLPLAMLASLITLPLVTRVREDWQAIRGFRHRNDPEVLALGAARARLMTACPALREL